MLQTWLLLVVATTPIKGKPTAVELTLLDKKAGKEALPSLSRLSRPPSTGCWKQTEPLLFNVLPKSRDEDSKPHGPWRVSAAPRNPPSRVSVSLIAEEPGGLIVRVYTAPGVAFEDFFAASDAPLDKVEVSADGKLALFYRSTVAGDLARYFVSIETRGTDEPKLLSERPLAFVSLSPDSRYALLEGGELVDLTKWTSTSLETLPEGYLQPVAWSCDSRQLVVVATESWIEPAWVAKWRVALPRPVER